MVPSFAQLSRFHDTLSAHRHPHITRAATLHRPVPHPREGPQCPPQVRKSENREPKNRRSPERSQARGPGKTKSPLPFSRQRASAIKSAAGDSESLELLDGRLKRSGVLDGDHLRLLADAAIMPARVLPGPISMKRRSPFAMRSCMLAAQRTEPQTCAPSIARMSSVLVTGRAS